MTGGKSVSGQLKPRPAMAVRKLDRCPKIPMFAAKRVILSILKIADGSLLVWIIPEELEPLLIMNSGN